MENFIFCAVYKRLQVLGQKMPRTLIIDILSTILVNSDLY